MVFAQITYRQSLRDIQTCLRAMQPKIYHCGIRGNVSRTTLAKANENRDWRIYAEFAHVLIQKAQELYANEEFGVQLKHATYALDSTTIDLCLSLFPWAKFRKHKAAVKVHMLMDLRGSMPCFIRIIGGKVHDVNILDELILEAGAIYIMDRAYFLGNILIRQRWAPGSKNLESKRRFFFIDIRQTVVFFLNHIFSAVFDNSIRLSGNILYISCSHL
jgi:hypothetical protein